MPRTSLPSFLGILFWSGMILGCESLSGKPPYAQDPLLVSKKPQEGKLENQEPVRIAYAEPAPPPLPAEAFVSAPPAFRVLPRPGALAAGTDTSPLKPLAQPTSSAQSAPFARPTTTVVEAIPVARHKTRTPYGHAPDHSWLQGVLEQADLDRLALRYCPTPADDSWGGKVSLEEDARLVQLRPGDIIKVAGRLVADEHASPRYRVRELWLVQRPGEQAKE